MNKNIILLEQLYEKRNNAYVKKEIALDNWDYDNEFLDDMTTGYIDGQHMNLYNYYLIEKDKYEILNNMYRIKYKNIINIVMRILPTDCIEYLNKYI